VLHTSHDRLIRPSSGNHVAQSRAPLSRRLLAFAMGVGVLVAVAPTSALADGQAIASATPVVYGQQEFGNTADGGSGESRCGSGSGNAYRSWWGLSVTAGDQVTVDWETQEKGMGLFLFPVGTTDFTFLTTGALIEQGVNINYKEQATYSAPQTGVLPVEFKSDTGCGHPTAPYNFTATVRHGVVLALPTVTTLPDSGTISVAVRNPDGVPINDPGLAVAFNVLVSGSTYVAIGNAPAINGTATVSFALPSSAFGHSVTIEASSAGASYLPGSSATQIVTVAKPTPLPPPPPPCIVPSVKRGETLGAIEYAIRRAHCAVGNIRHVRSRRRRRGAVISASPRSGSYLAFGTPVQIVISRGRH
jgi:hypothetical protein